jgi:HK97 family phage major capsid protein
VSNTEVRTVDVDVTDLDTRGRTLHGYASVYGVESHDLGGFKEKISPGAFAGVLNADVRCLLNHDPNQVLGRTRAGTLRLHDEERGLRFECDLPESPLGQNVREAVRRGDVDGASFRFVVAKDGESWDGDVRTVKAIKELHDVTVATYGAYPAASVELRTRPSATSRDKEKELDTETRASEETTRTTEGAGERTTATSTGFAADSGHSRTGLHVEDRAGSANNATIEHRVSDALRSVRKGEARSLTTSSASPIAPPELSTFLFQKLRASSVVLASGVRTIATDRESITWPKLSADVSPTWYGEGDTITPGDPSFVSLTATPRKLAHIVQLSNEVVEDSAPPVIDVVTGHLATMLGLRLDYFLLEGNGTSPQITGLKNASSTQSVSMGTNGAQLTNLDVISDALGLLEAANAPKPYAIVMPPRTWNTIRKMKDVQNRPLLEPVPDGSVPQSLFGAPVYTTSQLSTNETQGTATTQCNSIYVYSPSEVVFVRRTDATIEYDRSRLFNSDQSELRGKIRADLLLPNPEAVVRIVGVKP